MKLRLFLLAFLLSTGIFGQSGAELLLDTKKVNLSTQSLIVKKHLELSDTFLVQVYGRLKALNIQNVEVKNYFDYLFDKNYIEAIKNYPRDKKFSLQETRLFRASKMYLLWKLDLAQSFFNAWIYEVRKHDFLSTELGVALDQIISGNASQWLVNKGIVITKIQNEWIQKFQSKDSIFNQSVQGYISLRQGEKGFNGLKNLKDGDILALPLARSIVVDFARQGRLAEAGNIIKQIIEPRILESTDMELISDYYLLLARLLYQAKAYQQAKDYYFRIPDESSKFLTARVEALWISTIEDDFSSTLGVLPSLDLFQNDFLPERYLVTAMAQLKLCQFENVHHSINKYISSNKIFSKLIDKNLTSEKPQPFSQKNFYRTLAKNGIDNLDQEILKVSNLFSQDNSIQELIGVDSLSSYLVIAKESYHHEIKQEWKNKKRLIELSLQKMRFVKIEFLSTMRRLKNRLHENATAKMKRDEISVITSAIDKTDKLEFPHDGVLFGDELFNMYSKISSLCLQEKK